jgi:hypothetical protein
MATQRYTTEEIVHKLREADVLTFVTGRKLDFQGDRIREGFKGRVPGGNGVGPL